MFKSDKIETCDIEINSFEKTYTAAEFENYLTETGYKNKNFEFVTGEQILAVKGKLKQNYKFWQNTLKADETIFGVCIPLK